MTTHPSRSQWTLTVARETCLQWKELQDPTVRSPEPTTPLGISGLRYFRRGLGLATATTSATFFPQLERRIEPACGRPLTREKTRGYRVDNIARTRSAIRVPLVPGGKKPAKLPSASRTYVKDVWSIEYLFVPRSGTFSK